MQHRIRTEDVLGEAPSFRDLLLPPALVKSLEAAGYVRPSPVQQAAIPLACLGLDVIIQAKAGTGKTLVFAVALSELIDRNATFPQALVLAPTREVALQAADVLADADAPAPGVPSLAVATLIGGLPTAEDERVLRRRCHAVVGTPGRVLALIQRGSLVASKISILVLDEADKLLGGEFWADVGAIIDALPSQRQTLALSATVSPDAAERLRGLMRSPHEVLLSPESTSLLGVSHFVKDVSVPAAAGSVAVPTSLHALKRDALLSLLSCVAFNQAIVFCNSKDAAEALANDLASAGHAAAALSSHSDQLRRIEVLNGLRSYTLRVVVATDVAARGVDLDRVNLVVNVDLPPAPATLAHRVGRAGRFGTVGAAVTLVCGEKEREKLDAAMKEAGSGEVRPLPDPLPLGWSPSAVVAAVDAAALNDRSTSNNGVSGHDRVEIVSRREENGVAEAQRPSSGTSAPAMASLALDSAEVMEAEILSASLWPDERGPLPTPGPQGWPLQLSDLSPALQTAPPAVHAASSPSSASATAETDFFIADKAEETDLASQLSHYDAIIESLRQDLQRTPEAAAAASELLERAFRPPPEPTVPLKAPQECDFEADEVTTAASDGTRRRRPLGSVQAASYERQRETAERECNTLEEEAALLEAWAEEGYFEQAGTPATADDAATSEAAWRQYYIDHYNHYGYWPGGAPEVAAGAPAGDPLTPEPAGGVPVAAAAPEVGGWSPLSGQHPNVGQVMSAYADDGGGGYVRVPAAVLRRYLTLEWEDWQRRFFGHF